MCKYIWYDIFHRENKEEGKMRNPFLSILYLMFFFLFLYLVPVANIYSDACEKTHISGYNQFGIKLLKQIIEQDQGKDVFISPVSVALALAMTYNGTDGTTQEAMAQVLGVEDLSWEALNHANNALHHTLEHVGSGVQLNIANSLWARKGISFKPEFLQANESYYEAEVTVLNFADPKVPSIINAWVNQKTQEKIEKIVDSVNPATILFLINAIYFKGEWTDAFDEARTIEKPFTLVNGRQKQHPMMSRFGRYFYCQGEGFQAVILPYGDRNISMYVFLPDEESSLENFLGQLSPENWIEWVTQFEEAIGLIVLPRFRLEYGKTLNHALMALGMEVAFDGEKANFSRMCPIPPNVCIGEVKHKTFVDVNEEGTEAAAVTSVTMVATSIRPPDKEFRMIVNRPFFLAISDNRSGLILFMGIVMEPK
jgi:serpin B